MSLARVRRSGTGWAVFVGPYQIAWCPTRSEAREYVREVQMDFGP